MNFLGNLLTAIKPRRDDDGVDRMNYYYSTLLLLVFSITMSAKQYVGAPIQCWVPAQFTGAWEQYAENYCFVQNTYWLRMRDNIPNDIMDRDERQIGYYQWVPFVLAIEAIMFYFPVIVWRQFNWASGVEVEAICKMGADAENIHTETREKVVRTISVHIIDALEMQRGFMGHDHGNPLTIVWHCGKTRGVYVCLVYLACKLLYLINLGAQFLILGAFLDPRYTLWGAQTIIDLIYGIEWEESGHFPRVTLCDFEVRVLGNVHRYTIQCVLMVNMFNEKIFIFLWWWFVLVVFATIFNLFVWIVAIMSDQARYQFVMKYLRVAEAVTPDDKHLVQSFVHSSLRHDGVFVMRMMAAHAGDLVTTDVMRELWDQFKKKDRIPPHKGMVFVETGKGQVTPFDGYQEHLEPLMMKRDPGPAAV